MTPDYASMKLYEREALFRQLNPQLPEPQYAIVWEDPADDLDAPCKITVPSPAWLGTAMHGGILPPVSVYWALRADEEAFMKAALKDYPSNAVDVPSLRGKFRHTRGHLLHDTPPVNAMTEEQAMEYLIMKDLPFRVWRDYTGNRTILRMARRDMLPINRRFRNAWRIDQHIEKEAA